MSNHNQSQKYKASKVIWIGMSVNAILTLFKILAGFFGKSSAMIADGIHSFSDFVTDIVALLSFRVAYKPKDKNHQYGHGKFETLAGLLISIVLIVVGVGMAYSGVKRIIDFSRGEEIAELHILVLVAALLSILFKELLFRYAIKVGSTIKSRVVTANAWEHRSDVFSSIAVAIGIAGAIFLGSEWRVLDPILAIVVSVFVIKVGVSLVYQNILELTESSLSEEEQKKILDLVRAVDGVRNPHHLQTRRIGYYYAMDLHVEVESSLTVARSHQIGEECKRKIREEFGKETLINIHMDPLN